jgi:integrase
VSFQELPREEYGTHSLRRTKASIIYNATGNLRAVQILFRHTKIENTVRYLGVDMEDSLWRSAPRYEPNSGSSGLAAEPLFAALLIFIPR